jgi:galactose-1-phosphate uridylyltransferase
MRPKIRKVNTNKRKKERKLAQERLQKQTAAFLDHPKECCVCNASFDRTKETVKTWQVVTRENRVRLTCPDCWGKIEEIVEIKNEDK